MTEIAVREPAAAPAVVNDIDSWTQIAAQVIKMANEIADTPFVPDGLRGSVPAVAAAILAGRELGLPPLMSLANIHVIKGKPALSALLMRALIMSHGHQWEDLEVTDTRAVIRARRRGEAEWTQVAFTADQARHARIDLGGYPQDKLYARATSRLARRKFADVIAGMPYSAEELEDEHGDMVLAGETWDVTTGDSKPAGPKPSAPAARTARRRTPAAGSAPASPPAPAAAEPEKPADGLPPLPGEDEDSAPAVPDGQAPSGPAAGTDQPAPSGGATPGLVGIIRQHFVRLGFTDDEKGERLDVTSEIAGRSVGSTNELTQAEAKAVADTLSRCKDRAQLALIAAPKDEAGDD